MNELLGSLLPLFKFLVQLLGSFWPVGVLLVLVILAYLYGGRALSLVVGLIGSGLLLYLLGRRDARRRSEEIAREVQAKRKAAYDQISGRNTGAGDVAERLRKRDF